MPKLPDTFLRVELLGCWALWKNPPLRDRSTFPEMPKLLDFPRAEPSAKKV